MQWGGGGGGREGDKFPLKITPALNRVSFMIMIN